MKRTFSKLLLGLLAVSVGASTIEIRAISRFGYAAAAGFGLLGATGAARVAYKKYAANNALRYLEEIQEYRSDAVKLAKKPVTGFSFSFDMHNPDQNESTNFQAERERIINMLEGKDTEFNNILQKLEKSCDVIGLNEEFQCLINSFQSDITRYKNEIQTGHYIKDFPAWFAHVKNLKKAIEKKAEEFAKPATYAKSVAKWTLIPVGMVSALLGGFLLWCHLGTANA